MREQSRKSDREWQEILTPEQFVVTRRKGTEPAYWGKYCDFQGVGVYRCTCCGNALFSSEVKFEPWDGTRSKWPSFWAPLSQENVKTARDVVHLVIRTEVLCASCDAHLGYLLDDDRPPAGVRYVINSCALTFAGSRGRHLHASDVPPALAADQRSARSPMSAVP